MIQALRREKKNLIKLKGIIKSFNMRNGKLESNIHL